MYIYVYIFIYTEWKIYIYIFFYTRINIHTWILYILLPLKMAQVQDPFYARFRRHIHQKPMLFLISSQTVGPYWWHNLPKWGGYRGFYNNKDGLRHGFTNKCRCHLSVQWPIWAASCCWYVFDAYNTTSHNMLVLLKPVRNNAKTRVNWAGFFLCISMYIYIVKFSLCVWFCGRSVFLIPAAKGYHHFSVLKKENQLNTEQILFFVQHLNSWIQHGCWPPAGESNPCLPRGGEGWGIWCSLWKWGKSMPSPLPALEIGDPFYRLWWRRVGCIPDWTHEWD